MLLKTKIIATISNLNCSIEFIRLLHQAGMNVVRLNTAHMTHDDALVIIANVRKVSEKIGILLDTKGPEIRTCPSDKPLKVKYGDVITLKGALAETSKDDIVCLSYSKFVSDIPVGSQILIDDGLIALKVIEKDNQYLKAVVQNDGEIVGKKSVNIPSVHVKLPALSEKDKKFIQFAADNNLDFIAHSFVRSKKDVEAVQKILDQKKSSIKIIAKIENNEGIQNIDEILDHCYGIMIARGDLAVEIPTEKIPLIQKKVIRCCIEKRKPVIVATQMLHSMIDSPRPTRAEVSDVANACLDGADALMLSGETASGKYPEQCVKTMAQIAYEVENKNCSFTNTAYTPTDKTTSYLAKAAVKANLRLDIVAIVADSVTGKTILALAAYRGNNPIFAQVYSPRVMRQLSLSYGVYADFMKKEGTTYEILGKAIQGLVTQKRIKESDNVIVIAGNFGLTNGASYIEISTAANLKNRYRSKKVSG